MLIGSATKEIAMAKKLRVRLVLALALFLPGAVLLAKPGSTVTMRDSGPCEVVDCDAGCCLYVCPSGNIWVPAGCH